VVAHVISNGRGNPCSVTDSFSGTYAQQLILSSAGNSYSCIETAFTGQSGTLIVNYPGSSNTGTGASQIIVSVFSGVLQIGNANSNQILSTNCTISCSNMASLATLANSIVYGGFDIQSVNLNTISYPANCPVVSRGSSQIRINDLACQPILTQMVGGQDVYSALSGSAGTHNHIMSFSSSATCSSSNCWSTQNYVLELRGSPSSSAGSITQCYGNCGSPPVTLVTTNSTRSVNFNQSITLFYRFQSNLNGFVNNVTVSSARLQPSTMTLTLGVYVAPNCQIGESPFTSQCPGFLQSSQTFGSLVKQQYSHQSNVAVQLGNWIGISISAPFKGLDLNDTNTQVILYYASGFTPTQISQSAIYDSASKMGLWAFVTGNIAGGSPSTSSSGCGTPACGATALVAALGGGLFGGIVAFGLLFGITGGFLLYATRQHDEQGHIKGYALPTWVLGIIAIMLLIGLSSLGVLPVWIPLVIILLTAWLFTSSVWNHRKHEGGTGGNL